MFGVEAAVPIDFGVVETEFATFLVNFNIHVWVTSEQLVSEGAVFVLFADFVNFVDYRADGGVFVKEDGGNQVSIREVLVAEV